MVGIRRMLAQIKDDCTALLSEAHLPRSVKNHRANVAPTVLVRGKPVLVRLPSAACHGNTGG